MAWKFQIRELEKATGEIRQAILAGLRNGLEAAGAAAERLVKANIESSFEGRPPRVAYGLLAGSITSELRADEGLTGRVVVFAVPPADAYAAAVETGRSPGKGPPPKAIRFWLESPKMRAVVEASVEAIRARRKSQRRRPRSLSDEERAKRALTYLIGRKIARRGVPGHFMFARALEMLEPELHDRILREVDRAIHAAGHAPYGAMAGVGA